MRNNKHFRTILCLVLGAVLLTTAAVANYGNANGYNAYKQSLLNVMKLGNYTANIELSVNVDGVAMANMSYHEKYDNAGEVVQYTASNEFELDGMYHSNHETWATKFPVSEQYSYKSYNKRSTDLDGSQIWSINGAYSLDGVAALSADIQGAGGYDEEQMSQMVRIAELAADLLVGDLKNNFVYTGTENGNKSYQVAITKAQLPEIITALMDLLFDEAFRYHGNEDYVVVEPNEERGITEEMAKIRTITNNILSMDFVDAKCFVTLDENGNLVSNRLEGTLSITTTGGTYHEFTAVANITLTDVGTTSIDAPVIPSNAVVYDYSDGTYENNYAYTITKNGVVVEYTQNDDRIRKERDWFDSLDSYDRIEYLFNNTSITEQLPERGFEITDETIAQFEGIREALQAAVADGSLDYIAINLGVSTDSIFDRVSLDIDALIYGIEYRYNTAEGYAEPRELSPESFEITIETDGIEP